MANESQLMEVIKQAKETDKDRKFKQSVEMIMVFRDVDVKKGFAINETVQLPKKTSKPATVCIMASGDMGVKASVGINRDPKFKTQIQTKLLEVAEVVSISEVTGRFDIMIQVYAQDLEELHTIVIEKIGKIEGIQNTETFVELQKTSKDPVYLTKNV